MSRKSGAGKSGAGDECSGGSSIGGVERRGSSMSSVDKYMSFRPSVGKSNTGDECSGGFSTRGVELPLHPTRPIFLKIGVVAWDLPSGDEPNQKKTER